MAKSLSSRPMDLFYFVFFVWHLIASLLVDVHSILPSWLVPYDFLSPIIHYYIKTSGDPLMGGLLGYFGDSSHLLWYKSFIYVEMLIQVPVFVWGAKGMLKDSNTIYPLLLAYAASTSVSTLACVVHILDLSTATVPGAGAVTVEQKIMLLSGYVPFFVIPVIMTCDMTLRVCSIVNAASAKEETKKAR